jgi:hypothetical protein
MGSIVDGLGQPKIITQIGWFYKNWGILRRVSECEELNGIHSQEIIGRNM